MISGVDWRPETCIPFLFLFVKNRPFTLVTFLCAQQISIQIRGLKNFLIKDIGFIGTPGVVNDALISLDLLDIWEAKIQHCEFYGLSS